MWPCLFFFVVAFIPESFRWYFSKGRFEEGKAAICGYAARCGVVVPQTALNAMCAVQSDGLRTNERRRSSHALTIDYPALARKMSMSKMEVDEHVYTIGDLFKTPEIRILTLKMCFLFFTRFSVYYAVFMIDIKGKGGKITVD